MTDVFQPKTMNEHYAYLSGVIASDGHLGAKKIGLLVADLDFAWAFANSLNTLFDVNKYPQKNYRGYWEARAGNQSGRFDSVGMFTPKNNIEKGLWLRGYFDGDGNASLIHRPNLSENAYQRRVSFYSTDEPLLERANQYLLELEMPCILKNMPLSASHKGTKPMYELRLKGSIANYTNFLYRVGSSIKRKLDILAAIPQSYRPDISDTCRQAQAKGAAARRKRTMETMLPKVIEGVARLIKQGVKPTQRNCREVCGYGSIQKYVPQQELVDMALRIIESEQ